MRSRLQAVGEEEATLFGEESETPPSPPSRHVENGATWLLFKSLQALSQRTIVALSALVDLALLGSAFALWLMVIADPTPLQLTAVAGYAIFVLIALFMRRGG